MRGDWRAGAGPVRGLAERNRHEGRDGAGG
ncbi:hypothetical protein GA0115258_115362, partial [Streptomyces sp. LamerLS-31b]